MTSYPDHGSPVRKARERARASLPCESCGASGEPVIRRPRRFSDAWAQEGRSHFACPGCGSKLADIDGPAGLRPSDVPADRLPDPEGLVRRCFLPELQRRLVEWILSDGEGQDLAGLLVAGSRRQASAAGLGEVHGIRLPGREKVIPSLVLTGFGSPWLVAFCEVPGASPPPPAETLSQVLAVETVEAVIRLGLVETDGKVKISMRLDFADQRDPRLIEGQSISLRRRPRDDGRDGPVRH